MLHQSSENNSVNMIKQMIIVAVVVQLVYSNPSPVDRTCHKLSDCPCQEACVQKYADKRCEMGMNTMCVCKAGCVVFDTFVPANSSNVNLYMNSCRCGNGGQAACTRARWMGQPEGVPVYESNPNC